MYDQMSPTLTAADALLRDYEGKSFFGFRSLTTIFEYLSSLIFLFMLIFQYVYQRIVVPILTRFRIPFVRKPRRISFENDTVLITGGQQMF